MRLPIMLIYAAAIAGAAMASPAPAAPPPSGFISPLATSEQEAAEKRALKVMQDARVVAARRKARLLMLAHPLAKLPEGRARLDHALDSWLAYLAFQQATFDTARPSIVWSVNNSSYSWFGHTYPGSGAAIDSPDNVYRSLAVDGAARYEIHGQLRPMHPGQFSFQLVPQAGTIPTGTDLETLGVLTSRDLDIGPDGAFTITIDSEPAGPRRNHLRSRPGEPLRVIIRDTLTDWRQVPNELSAARLDAPPLGPPITTEAIATQTAQMLKDTVAGWLRFIGVFAENPPENQFVGPLGRTGGWGYMAPARFHIGDDEAMVITIDDFGAEYASIQLTDVWMIAPDPQLRLSSYTAVQSMRNRDGALTYVVSNQDPGAPNWVDTAGWNRGWVQLRWQGLPRTKTDASGLVRSVRIVKLAELAAALGPGAPRVSAEGRRAQLQERSDQWRLRVATAGN